MQDAFLSSQGLKHGTRVTIHIDQQWIKMTNGMKECVIKLSPIISSTNIYCN